MKKLNPPIQPKVEPLDSLFVELLLDKSLLDFKKDRLLKEIDQALVDRNKESFLKLTEELKEHLALYNQ